MVGFHGAFAMGVACQQGLLTLPGSAPLFGTCLCSNCLDQISRTCRVFTRLFTLNTHRCFLDFAYRPRIIDITIAKSSFTVTLSLSAVRVYVICLEIMAVVQ